MPVASLCDHYLCMYIFKTIILIISYVYKNSYKTILHLFETHAVAIIKQLRVRLVYGVMGMFKLLCGSYSVPLKIKHAHKINVL